MNIFIVDSVPLLHMACTRLVRSLVQSASIQSGSWAMLEQAIHLQGPPDIIMLNTPTIRNGEQLYALRDQCPKSLLILFASTTRGQSSLRVDGADLYLDGHQRPEQCFHKLHKLVTMRFPELASALRSRPQALTERQLQLVVAIASGCTNQGIAELFQISPHTVKVHLWRLFKKFGVKTRLQLIKAAHDSGMLI